MLLQLVRAFFVIGLFTLGGGYAMLPLMQEELFRMQWLTAAEFVDIVAIAEMTPGAISVNTATFVGFRLQGVVGALVATASLVMPSFIIIGLAGDLWRKHGKTESAQAVFSGLRPAVAGLIAGAAFTLAQAAVSQWQSAVVAMVAFVAIAVLRADALLVLLLAAVAGIILV